MKNWFFKKIKLIYLWPDSASKKEKSQINKVKMKEKLQQTAQKQEKKLLQTVIHQKLDNLEEKDKKCKIF